MNGLAFASLSLYGAPAEYSAVLPETPAIANVTGARRYDSHSMVMFPCADVDLMYSPSFDPGDFGVLRDMLWDLQEMARIGNWVTTWEPDVAEGDYPAGVVVTALQEGVITPEELRECGPTTVVARIRDHGIEKRVRRRWNALYRAVACRADRRDRRGRRPDCSVRVDADIDAFGRSRLRTG